MFQVFLILFELPKWVIVVCQKTEALNFAGRERNHMAFREGLRNIWEKLRRISVHTMTKS